MTATTPNESSFEPHLASNGGESPDNVVPLRSHSWVPVDLATVDADPPEPPTIGGLVYPGRRHVISGEPEALKTWLLLILAVGEIRKGRAVLWIDLEMGPAKRWPGSETSASTTPPATNTSSTSSPTSRSTDVSPTSRHSSPTGGRPSL
jgi:hypothetical protein